MVGPSILGDRSRGAMDMMVRLRVYTYKVVLWGWETLGRTDGIPKISSAHIY